MTEITPSEPSKILSVEQADDFSAELLKKIDNEPWKDAAYANLLGVKIFIRDGIDMIQRFEEATHQKHPEIHSDTDVIYIDSGPGPYSYNMLEPGKTDLDDKSYHGWKWSRKMDRARIRTAYTIASMVTAKRIQEQTGESKDIRELTPEDFDKYGPSLMYASTNWQNSHIKHALKIAREAGTFKIPDSKIVMYEQFTSRDGELKPIVHTQDQIEGLRFPNNPGENPPRRVVMVSHPAHLMRIMHILGKYPDSIPDNTVLQAFPISTPKAALKEYAEGEIMGTLATVFKTGRASLKPYANYELDVMKPMDKEMEKSVDEAYIFDVDGVVSHPGEKRPTIEGVLEAISDKLAKNEPVALNTGRSLNWMIERVIAPLVLKIEDKQSLQNFFAVGEKGGTWLTFNEDGRMEMHKDESISVPSELQDRVKRLVEDEFSDTTFYDDSKQTMISTEMIDGLSDEDREQRYRPAQHRIVQRFEELLNERGIQENFKVDPTTIATDIENKHVGKDFAVRRVLAWLSSKSIKPKKFIAFGDSKSDVPMAEELHRQGLSVELVFVGNKSHINPTEYSFPVTVTRAEYEQGTLEYLNQK